jgi:hypothetical protein
VLVAPRRGLAFQRDREDFVDRLDGMKRDLLADLPVTSSRSPAFRLGRTTSLSPARCAARTFCLTSPIREHAALAA